ncbi:MAG: DTW domain-containing protein [Alphaproteobacteria bacterium]|nr:DTW domain-containing protein [Alphaproteobacteria bacterium]
MGVRSKRAERCERCRLHTALCVCDRIPTLDTATRLVLVQHKRELPKTTATGPLALFALTNSEGVVHGRDDAPLDLTHLHQPDRRVLVLFPDDDARVLDADLLDADPRPVTLVVPDGNWRQASKIPRRVPGLVDAERVVLPEGDPTRYRLRREPRDGGLATLEAIARAYGVLEGAAVQAALEDLFDLVVERTLWTRARSGPAP